MHGFLQLLLDASESQCLRDVSSENPFWGRVPSHAAVPSPVSPVTRQLVAWSVARSIGRSVAFRANDRLSDQASDRISNRPSKPLARTQSLGLTRSRPVRLDSWGERGGQGRESGAHFRHLRSPTLPFHCFPFPFPPLPKLPFPSLLPPFLLPSCLPSSLLSVFPSFALPLRPPPCFLSRVC